MTNKDTRKDGKERKMGTRYKPNMAKLESLDDVNMALRDIGLAEKELESIDSDANKRIAEIKTDTATKGEALRSRIQDLSAKIAAFAEYNKADLFKDNKSVELSFGKFGWRKTTKISVKKNTLELLRKMKLIKCIRVKEEPDKIAMAELDDETLMQVDAVRKVCDDFFCEADTEEVNRDLLKNGA